MIYIEPCGGLGNRMRAIDSAIRLAKFKKTGVKVFWKVNDELGAPFEELFEPFSASSSVIEVINVPAPNYLNEPYDRYFTKFRKFLKPVLIDNADWEHEQISHEYISVFVELLEGKNIYDRDFDAYVKKTWNEIWPGNSYYIRSYSRFFGNPFSNYHYFVPKQEIRDKALQLVKLCGDFSCGVHIRRTDQLSAIEISTNDKYVAMMEAELKRNPNTKFLLTTDSTAEKKLITEIFADKIITAEINLGRDSVTAMKDAMMELYALAHMRKIIGSYWSSFTFTAISYLNYLKPYSIVK